MFVGDFYSRPRILEHFGEMAKVTEENKTIWKGRGETETFTVPFYLTKGSFLNILVDSCDLKWKGRLPMELPSSFIGLFCSFQHFVRVKIVWKSPETGHIGFTQEEMVFKVICNPNTGKNKIVFGVLDDFFIPEKDLDEIFPDDLNFNLMGVGDVCISRILEDIKQNHQLIRQSQRNVNLDEFLRSIVESDSGYNRSVSVELSDKKKMTSIASVHLRRTCAHPGGQLFIKIQIDSNLIGKIESIRLKLDCNETYPTEYFQSSAVASKSKTWRDTVKEIKLTPGCQDRLEIVFPLPPDLPQSIKCEFFNFQWELSVIFMTEGKEFDLKIPLQLYSLK